jgi:hypothetical protein
MNYILLRINNFKVDYEIIGIYAKSEFFKLTNNVNKILIFKINKFRYIRRIINDRS